MDCLLCQHDARDNKRLCRRCEINLAENLLQIPDLQSQASSFLTPSRTGTGSPTSERSIGFNVSAMDYALAHDILPVLHGYEAKIRRGRNLTAPALLNKEKTIQAEVYVSATFHIAHMSYSIEQDWVGEFARDIKVIHAKGLSVTKSFIEKPRRIPCPTDDCKNHIAIDIEKILSGVTCIRCKTSWTLYRLIQLAMANPNRRFWLDVEAIGLWLSMSKREILQLVKDNKIPSKNGLYDISAIVKTRSLL